MKIYGTEAGSQDLMHLVPYTRESVDTSDISQVVEAVDMLMYWQAMSGFEKHDFHGIISMYQDGLRLFHLTLN